MPTQNSSTQVDFRLKPAEKPKPANYPKQDPLSFLQPLFDSYVAPTRPASMVNPILNPIIAPTFDLPPKILLVTPTIDILLYEQLKFAERLKEEVQKETKDGVNAIQREVQIMIFEDCMHAWLECKSPCVSHLWLSKDSEANPLPMSSALIRDR